MPQHWLLATTALKCRRVRGRVCTAGEERRGSPPCAVKQRILTPESLRNPSFPRKPSADRRGLGHSWKAPSPPRMPRNGPPDGATICCVLLPKGATGLRKTSLRARMASGARGPCKTAASQSRGRGSLGRAGGTRRTHGKAIMRSKSNCCCNSNFLNNKRPLYLLNTDMCLSIAIKRST